MVFNQNPTANSITVYSYDNITLPEPEPEPVVQP